MTDKTIWTSNVDGRNYLIPSDVVLSVGDHKIGTATGRERDTNLEQLQEFYVSPDQAKAWLKSELSSVIGDLRSSFERTIAKSKKEFPNSLMQKYADRTGDDNKENLASLLSSLNDSSHALPARLKARMEEIAERLRSESEKDSRFLNQLR